MFGESENVSTHQNPRRASPHGGDRVDIWSGSGPGITDPVFILKKGDLSHDV